MADDVECVALEPCPFCGGKSTMTIGGTPEIVGHGYWVIGCYFNDGCAVKPVFYAHHLTEAEAIAAWNTRAAAMGWRDIEAKDVKLAFAYAFAAGFKIAEETSRQCIPALDDAWEEYRQIATLPPPPEPTT